ncbi:MAG TPA: hypothetical protein VG651_07220 [Stellaceae bacterium]|nr:hypothetical protein [Stellaceae bacterium]
MTKTILALAAAGVLGAAMVSTGANAMVPGTNAKMTTTSKVSQTRLNRERAMLRRDVRLGRTTDAARLRREINADERAIRHAKGGMQQGTRARTMQPQQPMPPQSPNQNHTNTQTPTPTQNQ